MALSMSVTVKDNFQRDVTFENSYITVDSVSGGKSFVLATVVFREVKDGLTIQMKQYQVPITLQPINFIEQSYLYIKSLDEFKSSTDC